MNDTYMTRKSDPKYDDDLTNKRYVDKIIETGKNENGNWVKYAKGTMICYMKKTYSGIDINNSWGSMYETNKMNMGDFPQPFIEPPILTSSCCSGSTAFLESCEPTETSIGRSWLMRPTSVTNVSVTMSYIAIGRWKQ